MPSNVPSFQQQKPFWQVWRTCDWKDGMEARGGEIYVVKAVAAGGWGRWCTALPLIARPCEPGARNCSAKYSWWWMPYLWISNLLRQKKDSIVLHALNWRAGVFRNLCKVGALIFAIRALGHNSSAGTSRRRWHGNSILTKQHCPYDLRHHVC